MPVIISKAKVEDIPGLVDVHYKTWLTTYPALAAEASPEKIRYRFEVERGGLQGRADRWKETITQDTDKQTYIAKKDERVVGFVLAVTKEDGAGYIASFYVLSEAQRQGIGGLLMHRALCWLQADKKPVSLGVVANNKPAIRFYEKQGFVFTRELSTEPQKHDTIIMLNNEMIRPPVPIA